MIHFSLYLKLSCLPNRDGSLFSVTCALRCTSSGFPSAPLGSQYSTQVVCSFSLSSPPSFFSSSASSISPCVVIISAIHFLRLGRLRGKYWVRFRVRDRNEHFSD